MVAVVSLKAVMRGNVLVLTVTRTLWSVAGSIIYAYFSLYMISLGASKPVIGLVNSLGALAACILYPIGGYIADKSGRARLVSFATLFFASSYLIYAFSPSWEWLTFAYIYQQIVLFYTPALNAIMADSIPIGARGRIYALTVAVPEAVRIVTPYIGGYLIAVMTLQPAMRLGYTLSFALGSVVALIRFRYLKETMVNSEGIGWNVLKMLKDGYHDVVTSLKWVFSTIKGYAIVAILISSISSFVTPFWVVYATEVIGLSAYDWGVVLLLAGIAKTTLSFAVGSLVDRLGPKSCMAISLTIAIPSMTLFTFADGFYQVVLVYIPLAVSSSFMWIATSVFLANSIPKGIRGRVMASLGSSINVGIMGGGFSGGFLLFISMSMGSLASGFVYSVNPAYPWYLQSIALLAALALLIVLIREPEKAHE